MSTGTDLATLQPVEFGQPLTAVQLKARLALIQSVMRDVMQDGVDYGVIQGTDKPTLLKPGAEKLCVTFRLAADDPAIERIAELGDDIHYRVRVPIRASDGTVLAVGVGECSTGEEKYRWRRPVHPREYENAPEDRRREKFTRQGDVWQQVRVTPADVANTVLKMAHKRAYVHATIMATAAGSIFTQDVEDLPDGVEPGGEVRPTSRPIQPPQRRSTGSQATATPPAGAATVVRVRVLEIDRVNGTGQKGPWTKYTIQASDKHKYTTFDHDAAALAAEAEETQREVDLAFVQGKYGRDLQGLTIVGRDPGAEG